MGELGEESQVWGCLAVVPVRVIMTRRKAVAVRVGRRSRCENCYVRKLAGLGERWRH